MLFSYRERNVKLIKASNKFYLTKEADTDDLPKQMQAFCYLEHFKHMCQPELVHKNSVELYGVTRSRPSLRRIEPW